MENYIREIIKESIETKKLVLETMVDSIAEISRKVVRAYQDGGKLLLFGNGGSAADAQHIAGELIHQFEAPRRKCLLALALHGNSSVVTAIGNDWSFEEVFERQVEGLATEKDVVIGFSSSGNSENIYRGLRQGKENGAYTVAFTGMDGGKIKDLVDAALIVPSSKTARIQEAHIMIGHILCGIIEKELFSQEWAGANH